MKNILVLAYVISPTRGSEYSVAWNYVQEMSKDNKLTVLYGASGNHMGDCAEMEDFKLHYNNPNVTFIPIYPNRITKILNYLNQNNIFVYTFYFAYNIWQKLAYKKAKELIRIENFDLIHFVGMIGYREPGYLWRLKLPYIWGPIGGANTPPKALMKQLPMMGKLKYKFRYIANYIQFHYNLRLSNAIKNTNILLSSTTEVQNKIKKYYKKDSIYIPENAINSIISTKPISLEVGQKCNLLCVGRLDSGKNLALLFEAISNLKNKQYVSLDIIGKGPLEKDLHIYAEKLGISALIKWHGQLAREQVMGMYKNAHLLTIVSISEGNPTTIWEAMSNGIPTMSFDHCGMHDTLNNGAGILIPIASNYNQNVIRLTNAIDNVIDNPKIINSLSIETLKRAQCYTWEKRRNLLNELYDSL